MCFFFFFNLLAVVFYKAVGGSQSFTDIFLIFFFLSLCVCVCLIDVAQQANRTRCWPPNTLLLSDVARHEITLASLSQLQENTQPHRLTEKNIYI